MEMKVKYMIEGSNVHIFKMNGENTLDTLPPRVYTVRFTQQIGFYLEITKDKLKIPSKIYGNAQARVDKCLSTYADRNTSTGVLLTGDKGTGKTLLMSLLANNTIQSLGLPVILVKDAFTGTPFTSFIESIGECCLIFDEFGKMYKKSKGQDGEGASQQSLLSLMDGVDKTKRLIIMTENSEFDINEFILNRPSRVYYHFRYNKLDEKSITDYCKDFDVSTSVTSDIINICRRSRIFSFDMLQSIVEEHLRFDDDIEEIINDLNIDISEELKARLEILEVIETATDEKRKLVGSAFVCKPSKYDYTYIKLVTCPYDTTSSSNTNFSSEVPVEVGGGSDDDGEDEFHIELGQLMFESNGKEVYVTNKFTVVARLVQPMHANYSLLV